MKNQFENLAGQVLRSHGYTVLEAGRRPLSAMRRPSARRLRRSEKNGRPGQKQHGVDIVGPDEIGRRVGVQCKRYKTPLTLDSVTNEVAKAEEFKPKLSALFIATTSDRDAKLQEQVPELSDKRVAKGRFAVALLFWGEIVSSLVLNPAVIKAHFRRSNSAKPIMSTENG